jgi:hypothetical protein
MPSFTEGPESLNYEPPIFYSLSLAFRLSTISIKRSGSPVLPRLNSVLNSYIFEKALFSFFGLIELTLGMTSSGLSLGDII